MKLKSVKSDYQKGQIGQHAGIGLLVQVSTDSRSENPNPTYNNISNHNPKLNTGRKLKQYGQNFFGHASGYYPENGVLQLSIVLNIHLN